MNPSLELLTEYLATTLSSLGVEVEDTNACPENEDSSVDLAAQLTLKLDDQTASLILATDAATAISLVRTIAGSEVEPDDPLLSDTMGEILNVVAGAARRRARFKFGVPTMARDKRHIARQLARSEFESRRCRIRGGAVNLFLAPEHADIR